MEVKMKKIGLLLLVIAAVLLGNVVTAAAVNFDAGVSGITVVPAHPVVNTDVRLDGVVSFFNNDWIYPFETIYIDDFYVTWKINGKEKYTQLSAYTHG